MELLRKGCKGDSVKELQTILGVTPDGDFGAKTEAAVRAFQTQHGLTPVDGIVGNQTMTALMVAKNLSKRPSTQSVDPSVEYDPLKNHITKKANRNIKYLAIHYTAGSRSTSGSAKGVKNVFETRSASADFVVDDTTMLQLNPDPKNYYCWAVGDNKNTATGGAKLFATACNANTISIEICSTLTPGTSAAVPNHEGWKFTDKALDNAVKLSKILMAKYSIPIERVVRHYDISGKLCPGILGWNNGQLYTKDGKYTSQKNNSSEWSKFLSRLK